MLEICMARKYGSRCKAGGIKSGVIPSNFSLQSAVIFGVQTCLVGKVPMTLTDIFDLALGQFESVANCPSTLKRAKDRPVDHVSKLESEQVKWNERFSSLKEQVGGLQVD